MLGRAIHLGAVMVDIGTLDDASPDEEEQFFAAFEMMISNDDGGEAARHLREGRAIYIADPRYPGRAVREHPDGKRELMRLDMACGQLVVERSI
ncbi:conserved hypothetical protein [Cupriavidus oxalaticus]|uniref:Uncharacterized protein n=2 Tax=Cupriavidus oxalaticus TaxID=96344 RepID=A0A375GFQ7_9BURK|nr:conserved hypothetical protein [Cupriavidus oxalaticus]SPC18215.1 conserved hypothetical protein [Cupriavidus oxalaticus]